MLEAVVCKIGVLKNFANFTGKHLCWSLFLINLQAKALNFIKKRLQPGVFCEICEIFQNIFFYRTPPVAASVMHIFTPSYPYNQLPFDC